VAHPRRALPPAEIDLPGGGATAAEAAAVRLGSKTYASDAMQESRMRIMWSIYCIEPLGRYI